MSTSVYSTTCTTSDGTSPAKPKKSTPLTSMDIRLAKGQAKLAMLTAYDAPSAALVDSADVDMVLVGDSLGMAVLGRQDTLSVTVDEMVHHCRAVSSVVRRALVVGDMPFMSYESSPEQAMRNAGRLMIEGGVRAVKLEGGRAVLPQVQALVAAGIPVMGHLGLTPQRFAALGGFKMQSKSAEAAANLCKEALALQQAGCFALVLECIPTEVARRASRMLSIPTIGIGAGPDCDGQVLVFHDMLGLNTGHTPRFVKRYAQLADQISQAVSDYVRDVRGGTFPAEEHTYHMSPEELQYFTAPRQISNMGREGTEE